MIKKKGLIFIIMAILFFIAIIISTQYFLKTEDDSLESNILSHFKDPELLQSIEKRIIYNSGLINEPAMNADKKDVYLELKRISVEPNKITVLGVANPNKDFNVELSNNKLNEYMPEFIFSTDYKNDAGTMHSLRLLNYEVYTENNQLFFLQQYEVPYEISDMSNLYIATYDVLGSNGYWSFIIKAADTENTEVTFNPNLEHSILNNTIDIKIKEVSFLNNKGELIIEQNNGTAFTKYALKDNDNNFYNVVNVYSSSTENNKSIITIDFYYPKTNIEDLILIPISMDLETEEIKDKQLTLPIELRISDIGSMSIESINFKPDYLKLDFKFNGANLPGADIRTGAFGFIDKDDNYIKNLDFIFNFNYQTGILTMTATDYSKNHSNLVSAFSGIWYIRQNGLSMINADSLLIPLRKSE